MTSPLTDRTLLRLPESHPPVLIVVIDTEEEFDWKKPLERGNTSVQAMGDAWRAQELFDEFGIRPTWVVDYPIATQGAGFEPLAEWVQAGRATVGAHLHPWVSPPHTEEVSSRNSYPGNLPPELEEAKLRRLMKAIEHSIGERPKVYKAGRYGFGPHTAGLLERLGFEVDLSPCAGFDFSEDGGPDWSGFEASPYQFGQQRSLLGVPATGGFAGWLSKACPELHAMAHQAPFAQLRTPGILSRLGAMERLMLSPEGYELAHLKHLTRTLLARGTQVFYFSFHSPSLRPGCTPYVRTESDLREFLSTCRQYVEFFLDELSGATMGPLELRELLIGRSESPPLEVPEPTSPAHEPL